MTNYATDANPAAQSWDGAGPAGRYDPSPAARRPGGGSHRREGNGRHRARRALPGAKPLLAAVALAATATTVVIGGKALSTDPQNSRTLSAPEPPAAPDALANTASGTPSGPAAATTAPPAQTTGPTRLPGGSTSTTPVTPPAAGPPSSAPTPATSQTTAVSRTPVAPSAVPLAAPRSAAAGAAPTSAPSPAPTGAAPTSAPSSTAATGASGSSGTDLDAAAAQVLAVINQARAAQGAAPLQMLAGLQTSADAHNHTMSAGCGLEHQCPGEPAFGDRENAAGVQWTTAGENIGDGGPVADTTTAIANMAVGLTNSMLAEQPPNDGHRRNILNPDFHHIGIELLRDSSGTVWMTQDFAN
ncbi:CAP domain-containing protein [Kitasatospora sp. NPDC008050]|uniref:CAP domain-containing protein n=1 Tax=Kitasatospora sp. NPDC008050 TaxID=3364021 RepID=UPI0036E301E6